MNRRNVVAGIAWAAPVVMMATAAPAFATSTTAPAPDLCPKGNRSQRHDGHTHLWDYHVAPGVRGVTAVWIGGEPATYDAIGRRWTRKDMPKVSAREQDVIIVVQGHHNWAGTVVFS